MKNHVIALVVIGSFVLVSAVGCKWQTSSDPNPIRGEVNNPEAAQTAERGADAEPASRISSEENRTPPIIGHLKGRTHTITIHTSPDGPRFSVKTEDGQVLAEALSANEIQAKLPEIYNTYRSTFARTESGAFMDASRPVQPRSGRSFLDASNE